MVDLSSSLCKRLPEGKILASGNLLHSWTNRNGDEKPIEMVVKNH